MKNLKLVKFVSLATISIFLMLPILGLVLPILGLAQIQEPPTPVTSMSEVYDILVKVMRWIFTFLLIFAVIFLFLAAFSYLTAAGDPEKIGKAKNQLIYAIVAIAIALVARGIEFILRDLLGA